MCINVYEVAVLVIPGLIGISLYAAANAKRRYSSIVITLGVAFVYFALYIWFSLHKVSAYSGSEIGSIQLIPETFLAQFFSAFPLALLKNGTPSLNDATQLMMLGSLLVIFVVAIIFFAQNLNLIRHNAIKTHPNKMLLFVIAFSLAVVPAMVLSISIKLGVSIRVRLFNKTHPFIKK